VPFTELDTVVFGAGIERTQINPGLALPLSFANYINRYGASTTLMPLTLGWGRDSRDSALAPTTGRLQRVSGEFGVAGDARYVRASYQFQQYVPLNRQYTLAFNSEVGLGRGLGGRDLPIFKNFISGGLGSVRGFEQGTLGPREADGSSVGGAKKITLNGEFIMPFPGAGNDRTLRMFAFVDAGNVYAEHQRLDLSDLRASTGVGISWISPLGPLRLGIASPLRKRPEDKIQRVQFQIGTSF